MARKRPVPAPAPEPAANLAGLVQACKDEPDDDGLRLILADYLEDHGEPERAELIRLGVQIDRPGLPRASVATGLAQVMRLCRDHGVRWFGAMPDPRFPPTFWRGFLSYHLDMSELRKKPTATWLASVAPWSERLRISYGQQPQIKTLVKHPLLAHFGSLELLGPGLDREHVRALAYGEHVAGLRELRLPLREHLVSSAQPLFEKKTHVGSLRSLALSGRLSAEMLRQLAAAPFAQHLRNLEITSQSIQDEGAGVLAKAYTLPQLRSLSLRRQNLGKEGLASFLSPAAFPQLRELHLRDMKLRTDDIRALAESPHTGQLEGLSLDHCEISDEDVKTLASSPHLASLRSLNLGANNINTGGLRALAASQNLGRLERLDLNSNRGLRGPVATAALFTLDRLTSLRDLSLAWTDIPDEALDRLVSGPLAPRLRRLRLSDNPLGPGGALKLANASSLRQLEVLELDGCALANSGLTVLAESKCLERLTWLSISLTQMAEAGLAALASGERLPSLVFLRVRCDLHFPLSSTMTASLLASPRHAGLFFVDCDASGSIPPELTAMRSPFPEEE